MSSASTHPGALRSGKSSRIVWIAAAWISGPGMRLSDDVATGKTSFSDGADAPTTTALPRSTLGSTRPVSTSRNDTVFTLRGGPG